MSRFLMVHCVHGGKFSASINSGPWQHMNVKLLLLAYHNFTTLVQRIFNCGEIQNAVVLLIKY